MTPTITMSEEERKFFLRAFKRLLELFSSVPAPEYPQGVKSETVLTTRILRIEPGRTLKGAPTLRVFWPQLAQPLRAAQGFKFATCFDSKFFQQLTSAVDSGQPVALVVERRGNYLNIVDVAA